MVGIVVNGSAAEIVHLTVSASEVGAGYAIAASGTAASVTSAAVMSAAVGTAAS